MDGNLRPRNEEMEGWVANDEPLRIEENSETSGITRIDENSRGFVEPLDDAKASLQISEWTNEKHSLYLNSIEASFVKQMHNHEYPMMDLHSWLLRKQNILRRPCSKSSNGNAHFCSGQFKVLKRGCWENINFRKAQTQLDLRNESPLLFSNPWVQHFRPSTTEKGLLDVHASNVLEDGVLTSEAIHLHRRKYRTPNCGPVTSSEHPLPHYSDNYYQDSVGGNTEVSDQNFVDEDSQKVEQLSSSCKRKRFNISGADVSIKDQVVPFGRSPLTSSYGEDDTSQREKDGDCGSGHSGKTVDYACPQSKPLFPSDQ